MKQTTFASTGFELVTKRTRKREFLDEMNLVVPWTELTGLIKPFAPAAWANAHKKAQRGQQTGVKSVKWVNQKNIISSGELLSINSRFCGGYSELPKYLLKCFVSLFHEFPKKKVDA